MSCILAQTDTLVVEGAKKNQVLLLLPLYSLSCALLFIIKSVYKHLPNYLFLQKIETIQTRHYICWKTSNLFDETSQIQYFECPFIKNQFFWQNGWISTCHFLGGVCQWLRQIGMLNLNNLNCHVIFIIKIDNMGNSQNTIEYNQEVPNSQLSGFSPIYRRKGVKQFKETPEEQIRTIRDLLKVIKQRYGAKDGIGEIVVSKEKDSNGEDIEKRSIVSHTYNEVYQNSYNLGRFILGKDLYFLEDLYKMKLLGIYSKNRYQWFITDWACSLFGLTSVPLYDTLGIENMSYCLNQTLISTIFVSSATVKILLNLQDIGRLRVVISYDSLDQQTKQLLAKRNLVLFNFWQIIKEGSKLTHINNQYISNNSNDCYTFSYTSGTTGPPKAAMLSHKNMLGCVASFCSHQDLQFKSDDRYLSYLPLPHSMERSVSLAMFYVGAFVAVSSGNVLKLKEDCQTLKVTIFLAVPRIYSRIVQNAKNKFAAQTGIKKCILDCGVSSKLNAAKQSGQYQNSFYDSVVFSKVRQSFGGCIRIMATGSAPMNHQVHAYMKAIMCCPFIEGYGQTESSAGSLFSRAHDATYGTLTQICTGLQVKLCDIPEMKYTAKDVDDQGRPTPRGELWMRGPQVFIGYYKQPEVTIQTINSQGWLQTGDIAQLDPNNKGFKIIDRKKNIFKLQQGEYLAPDKIENTYGKCSLVSEAFLHGDSHQYYAVGVVTPNRGQLQKLAEARNIKGTYEDICASKQIRKLVLTEMNNVAKKGGLHGFQMAKNIYLQPKGFLSKGILTNTMKLIRFDAKKVYKAQIDSMYKQGELPIK